MKGFIRQRGPSGLSWELFVDIGRDRASGRRNRHTETVKGRKRDAQRRLRELLHELDQGMPIPNGHLTLGEYSETWLRDVVGVRNRPRTAESYRTIISRHISPALGNLQLTELKTSDVEQMEATLLSSGLSPNTVRHVHVVLAKAIKDACARDLWDATSANSCPQR